MEMDLDKMIQVGEQVLMKNYGRAPLSFDSGQGCTLYTKKGEAYLDFVAGIAVNSLGYNHPRVIKAIQEQAAKVIHVSNLFWIEDQVKLAQLLVENSFGDKVFFCNSGAEANEGAMKLARKYAYKKYGAERHEIIAMKGSFHGRTMGTLAVTDSAKYQEGYGPLPGGMKFVPYNDLEALEKAITPATCAIMIEPIQGEGGVTPATKEFLQGAKALCDEQGILLILDEIQTGVGRTGKRFAYEHYGIEPHIMTLAKALGGGFPIGAVVATEDVAAAWQPGDHGTTFGGNPLACAAGVASLETILQEKLWEHSEKMGAYLKEGLRALAVKYEIVKAVRGLGLMLGLVLEVPGAPIVEKAYQKGLVINCTAQKVLRFVPPLIISEEEIDTLLTGLEEIFKDME